MTLNEHEHIQYKERLPQELAPEEVDIVMQLTTSYHEEGRKEGLQQGRQEGEVVGLHQSILAVLEDCSD